MAISRRSGATGSGVLERRQLTFLWEELPASPSPSPDIDLGWLTRVATSRWSFSGWLAGFDLGGSSGKTSPVFCRLTPGGRLEPSSGRWQNSGTGCRTGFWTLSSSECPSAVVASSLSDILETGRLPPRYFLSAVACAGILRRAARQKTPLPPILREALHRQDAIADLSPTLRGMPHHGSHANAGGQVAAVIFESRYLRNGRGAPDVVAPPLKAQSGTSGRGDGAPLVATSVAVRRLTVRECERLQGFPDDHTLVPNYRAKLRPEDVEDVAQYLGVPISTVARWGVTPDGPRYKAIGNSMAVPVMRWIGRRIGAVDEILRERAAP